MPKNYLKRILSVLLIILFCVALVGNAYALSGTLTIYDTTDGDINSGDILNYDISKITMSTSETLDYQWVRDGEVVRSGPGITTYTTTHEDIGKEISLKLTSSSGEELISNELGPVLKAIQYGNPGDPVLESKTHNSITLVAQQYEDMDGTKIDYEYALYPGMCDLCGGTGECTSECIYKWQDSNVFTGLMPNTEYQFIHRIKGTAEYLPSHASTIYLSVTTDLAPTPTSLSGTLTISDPAGLNFGSNLTSDTSGVVTSDFNSLNFQWLRDGVAITGAAESIYTTTSEDIGKMISLKITSDSDTGELTSNELGPVLKAIQYGNPGDPVLESKTHNSITLVAQQYEDMNGTTIDYEYALYPGMCDLCGGTGECTSECIYEWQDSNVFTGLMPNTEYKFIHRIKGTAEYLPSHASTVYLSVTTDPAPTIRDDDDDDDEPDLRIRNCFEFKVIDDETKEPIEDTEIQIKGSVYETNSRGNRKIYFSKEGKYEYTIVAEGYKIFTDTLYSPEEYVEDVNYIPIEVRLESNIPLQYYEFYESEIKKGSSIILDVSPYDISSKITKDDILFDNESLKLNIDDIYYLEDHLVEVKLTLDQIIYEDVLNIGVLIQDGNDKINTNTFISIISDSCLILNEKDIDRANIKLQIAGSSFREEIGISDIILSNAPRGISIKSVEYVSENTIYVKLSSNRYLSEPINNIVISVKKSGVNNGNGKSIITLGRLTLVPKNYDNLKF